LRKITAEKMLEAEAYRTVEEKWQDYLLRRGCPKATKKNQNQVAIQAQVVVPEQHEARVED
jgi:hypothetical protein